MNSRFRAVAVITLLAFACLLAAQTATPPLRTPAEGSGYSSYTQHEQVARFLAEAANNSPVVRVQIIGKTLEAKDLPSVDLRLCVITEEGIDHPRKLNRKKLTMLVFASQHGNEQSGKEAALRLIRDVAFGELRPRLKKMNLLVIPQANPYGNFINRRTNEQNLDLNRDHVKLEAPETRAIHSVFRSWMPEVTLDVHEKGDDYYRVSTGCVSNLNIHESLQRYSREHVFPAIARRVEADGYTWHEYLVSESTGQAGRAGERAGREVAMRYSTPDLNDGRNSPGIYETLSFIQEGASKHDLPTLEARTGWQYSGIRALVDYAGANSREIRALVGKRRSELLRRARRSGPEDKVHLKMEYVRDPKEPQLVLKRFARPAAGAEPGAAEPGIVTETIKDWRPVVESRLAVPRPAGYIVPASGQAVVKNLTDHGIRVGIVARDTPLDLEAYRIEEIIPAKEDYEAPARLDVRKERIRGTARKGDYFVACDQPAANLIPSLLEPQSEYGLIRYQAMKLAPARGELFPISRVVKGRKPPVQ